MGEVLFDRKVVCTQCTGAEYDIAQAPGEKTRHTCQTRLLAIDVKIVVPCGTDLVRMFFCSARALILRLETGSCRSGCRSIHQTSGFEGEDFSGEESKLIPCCLYSTCASLLKAALWVGLTIAIRGGSDARFLSKYLGALCCTCAQSCAAHDLLCRQG